MRLFIRQRIFSWTDSYDIYDENGNARYEVRGAFFSLGHQIHVYDKNAPEGSCEVGWIRQKLFTLMPTFEIILNGQVCGTIRKEFTLLRPRYHVDFQGWDVTGNLMGWDYQVVQNDRPVLTISKELFRFTDAYVLDYANAADEIPALLLVLAIDAVNCTKKD